MNTLKKMLCFLELILLMLSLATCGVPEEPVTNDELRYETVKRQVAEWLSEQSPRCEVIDMEVMGAEIILLTGIKKTDANIYSRLKTFVLKQEEGSFSVVSTLDGEPSRSNGFVAYGFCTEEHTVIFGDTLNSVYNYIDESRVDVVFEKTYVILEDGTSIEFPIESNVPYLIVLEGKRNVVDMDFWSAEYVAKYSLYYSEYLMRSSNTMNDDTSVEVDDTAGRNER